jgi:hypothetical protein
VKPYLWALGPIWGAWFVVIMASTVLADDGANSTAALVAYLSWFVGIPIAAVVSVLACAAIACGQCSAVHARRKAIRLERKSS